MKKILIVDDEEAVCWALNRALTQEGHRVLTAGSAEEGLSLAEKEGPDTIVLDVRLPGMDGLSALAKFRELAAPLDWFLEDVTKPTALGQTAPVLSEI